MIRLYAKSESRWSGAGFVARVTTDRAAASMSAVLRVAPDSAPPPRGFAAYLHDSDRTIPHSDGTHVLLPEPLRYLSDGDIVRVDPGQGGIWVMYRAGSPSNAIFLTERCNSNCIMCSQPPRDVQDGFLVDEWLEAIPMMSADTPELGITGGEPTLLGDRLIDILRACRDHLPATPLHMLSNGRLFNYMSLCEAVASVTHPDLVIGIPLYSDLASHHEFVVQAAGAYDQTIRGIMNLARCGVSIEIRVVLHQQTITRLEELARFITRNMPFVNHVALMGLEMMGYVRMNLPALWVDPVDYQAQLGAAVRELTRAGLNTSIYNHQLCVLDRSLWPFARKSISDWKNEFLPECDTCFVRDQCGGFFASAKLRYSDHIRAVVDRGVAQHVG